MIRVRKCLSEFQLDKNSEIRRFSEELNLLYSDFTQKFCTDKSNELFGNWTPKDYLHKTTMPDKGTDSKVLSIQIMLINIREHLVKYIGKKEAYRLITQIVDNALLTFDNHKDWNDKVYFIYYISLLKLVKDYIHIYLIYI